MSTERIVILLLAIVITAYLLIALAGTIACIWHASQCAHVDFKYFLGEPLSALLGMLGGRFLSSQKQ